MCCLSVLRGLERGSDIRLARSAGNGDQLPIVDPRDHFLARHSWRLGLDASGHKDARSALIAGITGRKMAGNASFSRIRHAVMSAAKHPCVFLSSCSTVSGASVRYRAVRRVVLIPSGSAVDVLRGSASGCSALRHRLNSFCLIQVRVAGTAAHRRAQACVVSLRHGACVARVSARSQMSPVFCRLRNPVRIARCLPCAMFRIYKVSSRAFLADLGRRPSTGFITTHRAR